VRSFCIKLKGCIEKILPERSSIDLGFEEKVGCPVALLLLNMVYGSFQVPDFKGQAKLFY
jgi:hypothetical protein